MADSDHLFSTRLSHTLIIKLIRNEQQQEFHSHRLPQNHQELTNVLFQVVHIQSEMIDVINAHHVLQLKLQLDRLSINYFFSFF